MTTASDLAAIRRAYARQVAHAARAGDPRLEDALATVPREDFLGSGPWNLMRIPGGYQATPDGDPVYLYQDTPVAILSEKRLNNGQPSFLAMLIGLCAVRPGDHVVHIGTGTGYYTALLGPARVSRRPGFGAGIRTGARDARGVQPGGRRQRHDRPG